MKYFFKMNLKIYLLVLIVASAFAYQEEFQLEKHQGDTSAFELIKQIQSYLLNNQTIQPRSRSQNATNGTWDLKDFEKHGFNMSTLVEHLANRTLMNQLA